MATSRAKVDFGKRIRCARQERRVLVPGVCPPCCSSAFPLRDSALTASSIDRRESAARRPAEREVPPVGSADFINSVKKRSKQDRASTALRMPPHSALYDPALAAFDFRTLLPGLWRAGEFDKDVEAEAWSDNETVKGSSGPAAPPTTSRSPVRRATGPLPPPPSSSGRPRVAQVGAVGAGLGMARAKKRSNAGNKVSTLLPTHFSTEPSLGREEFPTSFAPCQRALVAN